MCEGWKGLSWGVGQRSYREGKTRDSLLEHNVNIGGDASCGWVVDPITKRLGRIAHEHTTDRFEIQFATLVVMGFGKGNASKHTERCSVWGGTCEKG
jgi:hypothetical protein